MRRAGAALAAAALALALAGCGGDEEEGRPATGGGQADTAARTTGTEPSRDTTPTTEQGTERVETASPEEQPGGAGDEVPARTEALFSGRDGRIEPRRVRVPPFIAVRAVLRSGDGRAYSLSFPGHVLSVSGRTSAARTLPGLRPGAAYEGRASGGATVRIEATAEPGP